MSVSIFNSPLNFYPLVHIAEEAQNELQDAFNTLYSDLYSKIVASTLPVQVRAQTLELTLRYLLLSKKPWKKGQLKYE